MRDINPSGLVVFSGISVPLVEAGLRGAEERGWDYARMREAGISFFLREHWIRFLKLLSFRDDIDVTTWISPFKRVSVSRHTEVGRQGYRPPVRVARSLWACMDPTSGAPTRIPPEVDTDFAPQMTSK